MPKVVAYHRPSSFDEALTLLAAPDARVLSGGTVLNASWRGEPVTAVDIQSLGLGGVEADGARLRVGATVTLQQLADRAGVPPGLRDLARRELPSTLRTLGTLGGTVAAGGANSALLAGLLVHDAVVSSVGTDGARDEPLSAVLAARQSLGGRIVVAVTFATDGRFASAATARTPGDDPIVAACARRTADGTVRLALAGVAEVPVLVDDPAALDPPGDFRGSPEYRRHVAVTLAARVRQEVAS